MRPNAMKSSTLLAALLGVLTISSVAAQPRTLRPVTDAMLQNPEPGETVAVPRGDVIVRQSSTASRRSCGRRS